MPQTAPSFLLEHVNPRSSPNAQTRPFVTVTWAQSLDAKIAGKGGERVIISGEESMEMTHWMRVMHDAILIGINTLLLDDPRLKAQLVVHHSPSLSPPQPLILDPKLRFPLTSRILTEWTSKRNDQASEKVMQPWLLCGEDVPEDRRREVEQAGARVIPLPLRHGRIPPEDLPEILQKLGLGSVMVEGGSRILSAFLRAGPRRDGSPLVDRVVVTVGPMFIGDGIGVVPREDEPDLPQLCTLHTETMGKDAVMVCAVR